MRCNLFPALEISLPPYLMLVAFLFRVLLINAWHAVNNLPSLPPEGRGLLITRLRYSCRHTILLHVKRATARKKYDCGNAHGQIIF